MWNGFITKVSAAVVLLLLGASCAKGPPKASAIGEAFVGPSELHIRSDIPPQSATVAILNHGDRVEILNVRRKFLRVRTSSGAEGWTDERQLLAASDMKALKELAAGAAKLPNQGVATTYGLLNVHTQPLVTSPSFLQLKEGDKVDVLRTVLLPRSENSARAPLVPRTPKKKVEPKKKERKQKGIQPPMPKPPPLPADWLEHSKTDLSEEEDADETDAAKPPPRIDSWSLVRAPNGQSGWALTRLLTMAIPDEVAQYAEGKRIVSYFSLGELQDGDQKKPVWLWTTTSNVRQPWDFDSFRVFVWSIKRHRYETAHIERNLHGYSPVLVKRIEYTTRGQSLASTGFSLCVENKESQRVRREYALLGNQVRFMAESACEAPVHATEVHAPTPLPVGAPPAVVIRDGFLDGLKRRWHTWRGK